MKRGTYTLLSLAAGLSICLAASARADTIKEKIRTYGGCWNDRQAMNMIDGYRDKGESLDDVIAAARNMIPKMNAAYQKALAKRDADYYAEHRDAIERDIAAIKQRVDALPRMLSTYENCKKSAESSLNQYCKALRVSPAGSMPSQITPGGSAVITMAAPEEGPVAVVEIKAGMAGKNVVVNGRIRNVGQNCTIGTFQPLRLHPIATGLPIGWHILPEGIHANPTLKPGQYAGFEKLYASDYKAGFNIAMGTFQPQ